MKAIILARVSTEEQKEAGNSLPAQVARIESYCKKNNFTVIDTYSFDESAYKEKRDEFDKILSKINEQKEKIAICFDKVDRFSRNVFDQRVSALYELAMKDEVELHFVSDNLIITPNISATEKFHFGINLGLAKYYSDAISDSVKRTYEKMRRNGVYPSKPPLGYVRSKDAYGKSTIILDLERSHIVTKMFELYATGNYSIETLRQEVIKMGLKSYGGLLPPKSCIDNMIRNSFYYGIVTSKKYPPYAHKYQTITTKEIFDKCQEVREKKRTSRPKFLSKDFIFKGLLTCKNCNCLLTPEMHQKKSGLVFIYYSCKNTKGICKRFYIPEKKLLEPIIKDLELFEKIPEEAQEYLVKELRQATESEVVFHKNQVSRIRAEYDRVKQRDDNLLEIFLDKSIDKDTYDKKHQEYQDKLQLLGIESEEHTRADFDYQTTVATIFSISRRAKSIFESSDAHEKRAFLNYLIQNPTVSEKNLVYTLRSPYNLLLEMTGRPSWGDYWELNPD
ncbi:MAG: recombinase family protein [Patescibacteria group bacterium]